MANNSLDGRRRKKVRRKVEHQGMAKGFEVAMTKSDLKTVTVLLSIFAMVCVIAGSVVYMRKTMDSEKATPQVVQLYQEKETLPVIASKVLRNSDVESARHVLELFLESTTASGASFLIHNRVDEISEFKNYFVPIQQVVNIRKVNALEYSDGSRSVMFLVSYDATAQEVHVYSHPEEDFKVDWKSVYLCDTISLDSYLNDLPDSSERLLSYVNLSNYYTKRYNEKDYQSVLLTDYSGKYKIYGYLERQSESLGLLYESVRETTLLKHGMKVVRGRLEIKLIESRPLHLVEVTSLLGADWLSHL